jgi:hypothetical protein
MLQVKGETGNKTSEEHDGDVVDRQTKLQREIKAHDHVDGIQDDAVTNAHDVHEKVDMFPKREIDGVQKKRQEKYQQRRTGDKRHRSVATKRAVH